MTFALQINGMKALINSNKKIKQSATSFKTLDLRIDKKEFEILTEDGLCIIDEVEFVKIIDIKTEMPLQSVSEGQQKVRVNFMSHIFNRLSILPLTLPLCLVLVLGVGNVWGQTTIAQWHYDGISGSPTTYNANVGTGTSSIVGSLAVASSATGMHPTTNSGCGTQNGSNPGAWSFTANPGASNESSGVRYNTSTVGYQNITFRWDQRWSNASTNTVRLQYTTDGTNWTNFTMTSSNTTFCNGSLDNGRFETNTTGDQYRRITVDLSGITGVNNNANFGVRILAAHYRTTGQFRQVTSPTTQATAGTWRFDNVTISGTIIPSNYNVTYNGNLNSTGSAPTDATNYSSGATVSVLGNTGTLARTGYTFAGWNTLANGSGTDRAAGSTFTISANTTLFAKWTANSNTITFDGNGFTGGSTASQNINTAASANLTANGFTRAGFTFAGWNTASNGTGTSFADQASFTMGTTNVTLYAQWTANSLMVTYDSQGGSNISNGSTSTGGTVSNPGNPTRSGYSFNGWFVASSGGSAISFPYTHGQTSSFILYAQWTVVASPTIDLVTLTSAMSTTYGTASTEVSFITSGSNLNDNFTVTAQVGYQVSTDNTTFGSSFSVSSGTTVYLRFSATQVAGSYNNATAVVLSSTGATSVNGTTSSSGNIVTAKALTISGISISNKVYDGNTTATISGTAAYSGLVNGESFTVTGTPSAVFNNKNVGTAKPISVSGYTAPSVNYSITQPTGLTADVIAKALAVTSPAVTSKAYDGNTNATITGTLSGIISGDESNVSLVGTGTFASANVGTGIVVTSNSTLGGSESGNYSLTQPTGLTGEITKANQTITFGALANKTTNDTPFNLTATASSGLTVSYTSSNTSVATIVGNTVTIVGVGTTTITATQSGNSNFNAASDVTQTLTVTLADIEEIIFPQYIQGVNGTNANRIPSSYYLKVNNLSPNTTYRFYCGFVTASDLSTSSGAGNNIYVNYAGGSFTRSSSPSLATAGNYSTLTTNSTGSYTGWFVMEPTGNATRFVPGTNLYLRVSLNDGNNGTTVVNYRTSSNTSKVINLVASAGSNNGTGLYGISSAASKNFVVLFDNTAGTGRPISASFIEDDGTANTTANSYSSFYNTNVNGVSGAYGVVVPNNNVNGVKRIEFKKTSDNSLIYAVTDNDAVWAETVNTINPTGGTIPISLPHSVFDDAIFNESSGISLNQNTTINNTLYLLNGTLNLGANNLTLNGVINRTSGFINASNSASTVTFGGSIAQSIPSSTFIGEINNLNINNSQGLTTNQNLTVTNVLTISNGVIDLGASNLILGTNALISVINPSSSKMILTSGSGELRKRYNPGNNQNPSGFLFPIGTYGSYSPVHLDFTNANFGSDAYLRLRVEPAKSSQLSNSISSYLNRNWIVEPNDISNFTYDIRLKYNATDFVAGGLSEDDIIPIKYSNGQWNQPAGLLDPFTNATNESSNYFAFGISSIDPIFNSNRVLLWGGLQSFSEFGGAGQTGQPLPVELVSFKGSCIEEQNILTWQTASESNSSHFDIEKSRDGEIWNVIGKKEAAGNSNELLTYQFVDAEKNNSKIYYRLNQVDFDGKSEYFGPVTTDCDASNFEASTLPNPSNGNFWVKIQSNEASSAVLCIVDVKGNNLFSNEIIVQEGINLYQINSFFDTGIYFIHIYNSKDQKTTILKHLQN
jgi:uncharacterized repeat protein (TIGR02543 family)